MQDGPSWPPLPQRKLAPQPQPLFVDATDELKRQCSALALGQMVHPSTFTLLDSMTCISISDPRMDSGIYPTPPDLVPEQDRIPPHSLPSFDSRRLYTLEDVTWIMDRLTACEVAFHQSTPLSQTLFTCLLYHSIQELGVSDSTSPTASVEDTDALMTGFVLRAYLVATIKCFGLIWQELIKGNILEGEDASTDTCNLSLLDDLDPQAILHEVDAALAWIQDVASRSPRDQQPAMESIARRLAMRSDILAILKLFPDALRTHTLSDVVGGTNAPSSMYFQLRHLSIRILEQSKRLGRPQNSGGLPPRPIELPSRAVQAAFWETTTTDWTQAATVNHLMTTGNGNKWEQMTALVEVKGLRALERPSSAYSRSLLQTCLCPPSHAQPALLADFWSSHTSQPAYILSRALQTLEQLIVQPLSGKGGSDFSSRSPLDAQSVNWWLQKGEGLLANYLLSCLANRSRARRLISKSYSEWTQWAEQGRSIEIQLLAGAAGQGRQSDELKRVFTSLNQAIDEQTVEMALFLILSGFDLDLYSKEEQSVAYWLALKMSVRADEGKRGVRWRTDCLRLWSTLICLPMMDESKDQLPQRRPSWTVSSSHRKAIFKRRFKWLRLPTRGQEGQRQDPERKLEDLWSEWLNEEEERSEKLLAGDWRGLLSQYAVVARDAVQSRAGELARSKRWTLCREEAQLLNDRLLSTIEEIQAQLTGDSEKPETLLSQHGGNKEVDVEDLMTQSHLNSAVDAERRSEEGGREPGEEPSATTLGIDHDRRPQDPRQREDVGHHPWFPLISLPPATSM